MGVFLAPIQRCISVVYFVYSDYFDTHERSVRWTEPYRFFQASTQAEFLQYFLNNEGEMKLMDTRNYEDALKGVIVDVGVWNNKKGQAYLGIKCLTSKTTGFQLNLKCNNLQYCARQAVAKLGCIKSLSTRDEASQYAYRAAIRQESHRGWRGANQRAFKFEASINGYPVADERLAAPKDPLAFMEGVNFLRSELGLQPQDSEWLMPDKEDYSQTPSVEIDSVSLPNE